MTVFILKPFDDSSMGINDTRNPGIGATNDENSIFHSPKYTNGQKLMRSGRLSNPGLIGNINNKLGSPFYKLSEEIWKNVFPAYGYPKAV